MKAVHHVAATTDSFPTTHHTSSVVLLEFLLVACVALLVEVREEEEEQDTVQSDPHHETLRVVTLGEQQLELVSEDHHKLYLQVDHATFSTFINIFICYRLKD